MPGISTTTSGTTTTNRNPILTEEGREFVGRGRGRKRTGTDLEIEQPPSLKKPEGQTTQKGIKLQGKEVDNRHKETEKEEETRSLEEEK